MAKKYYWLQLKEDFFAQKEIKKLRKIAGGDTYTVIYLKMLLLSLKNDGKLYFDGVEDNFAEEISLEIDEEIENVQVVLMFLIKNNLIIELSEEEFFMTKVPELIGKESDSASRVRKYREKKKLLEIENKKALQCNDCNVTGNECNDLCNTEIEIEKEIEKEKEIKKEIEIKKTTCDSDESHNRINYSEIMNLFNSICKLPKLKIFSDNRKAVIRTLLKNEPDFNFKEFFEKIQNSDFLTGRNGKGFSCGFDWIFKPANRIKILEGNYDNKDIKPSNNKKATQATNYEQREYSKEFFDKMYDEVGVLETD